MPVEILPLLAVAQVVDDQGQDSGARRHPEPSPPLAFRRSVLGHAYPSPNYPKPPAKSSKGGKLVRLAPLTMRAGGETNGGEPGSDPSADGSRGLTPRSGYAERWFTSRSPKPRCAESVQDLAREV